jgi:predicted XRE-type DNA-binding protein
MKASERTALDKAGWAIGSAEDFLEMSDDERAFVEVKLVLAEALRTRRQRKKLTQTQVAKILGSSQPRVAKMEAGDSSVTVDLLVRSLFAIGATPKDLAKVLARGQTPT